MFIAENKIDIRDVKDPNGFNVFCRSEIWVNLNIQRIHEIYQMSSVKQVSINTEQGIHMMNNNIFQLECKYI